MEPNGFPRERRLVLETVGSFATVQCLMPYFFLSEAQGKIGQIPSCPAEVFRRRLNYGGTSDEGGWGRQILRGSTFLPL